MDTTLRSMLALVILVILGLGSGTAATVTQDDWSAGPGEATSTTIWSGAFAAGADLAWLATPGRLALAGTILGAPEETVVDDGFAGPAGLAAADLDGDGRADLVGAALAGDQVAWWRNPGGDGEWVKTVVADGVDAAISVATGDLDGDGAADIVAASYDGNRVSWWSNPAASGAGWSEHVVDAQLGRPHWVSTVDLDADDDLDLLVADAGTGSIILWSNQGGSPPALRRQLVADDFAGARAVAAADLDGDGDLDLVGAALTADTVRWWRNDGGDPLAWTAADLATDFDAAHHVAPGDLDGDGDQDVVGAAFSDPRLRWWENDGGQPPAFTSHVVDGLFVGALVTAVADLDGDNRRDLAATAETWRRVNWWRSLDLAANAWEQRTVDSFVPGAWPLLAADLDGDGAVDLAAGAGGGTEVSWWRLSEFVAEGWLESTPLAVDGPVEHLLVTIEASEPAGTSIGVEARCLATLDDPAPYQPVRPGWSLPCHLTAAGFVQYRLTLATTDPRRSPLVDAVTVAAVTQPVGPGPRHGGPRTGP